MKYLSLLLTTFFVFLLFPKNVIAWQVVINEFVPNSSTEWVELYNNSDSAEYLKSFYIDDDIDFVSDAGSGTKKSLSTLNISNPSYPVFETSGFLNNSGDYVVIFSNEGVIIDQYQYTQDPGNEVSFGRSPNGIGNFSIFTSTSKGLANPEIIPTSNPTTSPSVTETPTTTQTSSPTPAKSIYKINKSKDQDGQLITGVKINIDNQYIHHEDDEILEFCINCFCDPSKSISCGYGEHTIKLTKSGYSDWSEIRNISQGNSFEITPILSKISQESSTTSTPSPTISITPFKTPTITPTSTLKTIMATSSSTISAVLGESTESASLSADIFDLSPTSLPEKKISKITNYKIPFFVGLFFAVSSGSLLYFRHRKD